MDKESKYLLQLIDCSCNDCAFMVRDMERYKQSQDDHYVWQWDYFTVIKNKLIEKAKWYRDMFYDLERWDALLTEAENMKFQFDRNEAKINFGHCSQKDCPVTFLPNTCQLDTQECFSHRNELKTQQHE